MAEPMIESVGDEGIPLIVDLYNQIFRPLRDAEWFRRRFQGRNSVLRLVIRVDGQPQGFFLGYELKPDMFYAWFYGVLPEARRAGLGSLLMDAAHLEAQKQNYKWIRLECENTHRPMLHLAIELGYDVVGLRWDAERKVNVIIFEKLLGERTA